MNRRWIWAAGLVIPAGLAAVSLPLSPSTYRHIARLDWNAPESTALMRIRQRQAERSKKTFHIEQRWVSLDKISPHLQRAVIAAEDGGFYTHHGVEWGLLRDALIFDLKKFRWARGASTLTQQLAKNLYLSPSKNPFRKAKEIVLAMHMERRLSKRRILELYLNVAEWGHGVFGAEAASRHYFEKPALDLTPEEAVALAAVLPSPRKNNPLSDSRWVEQRKAWVRRRILAVWGEPAVEAIPEAEKFPEAGTPPEVLDDEEEEEE